MALLVHKYGGTSLETAELVKSVAARIVRARGRGDDVVAVVSAMGDSTDALVDLAHQISPEPDQRELDLLLSTGELVSSALLAMALRDLGQEAVGLSGQQAGIRTERRFGQARITDIDSKRIRREVEAGRVVIVAGFQGATDDLEVTTLGRGGSDTTAVALTAALKAKQCLRYTDVEGVFTADPRIVPDARKLVDISYDEMLELASYGAKVMHPRAVELASVYNVPIAVSSSFSSAPGTMIHSEALMEGPNRIRGVAHDLDVAKVTVHGVPDRPGAAATFFEALSEEHIRVDTIVQNASAEQVTDLTFTVAESALSRAMSVVEPIVQRIGATGLETDAELAKVSVVGTVMRTGRGYAARTFEALHAAGVNIDMITTSEIRITAIIHSDSVVPAAQALHKAFALESMGEDLED